MADCTRYTFYDYDDERHTPCKCPVCQGFLKWENREGEGLQPICNRCETPLISYPDVDEDTGEVYEEYGKICALSEPNMDEVKAKIKIKIITKKIVKQEYNKWKSWL